MSKAIITEQHLHDIADAIIAKGGATAPMTPAQMPAAIASIPSVAPNQGGIPDEGWKNDGASHFWNYIDEDGGEFTINISKVAVAKCTIFWGDGTSQDVPVKTYNPGNLTHSYSKRGSYRVDVVSDEGGKVTFGNGSSYSLSSVHYNGGSIDKSIPYTHIEYGSNADQTGSYVLCVAMGNLLGFKTECVGDVAAGFFASCQNIKFFEIGNGFSSIRNLFQGQYVLFKGITIPKSVTNVDSAFYNSRGCKEFLFDEPSNVTVLNQTFRNVRTLERCYIPASVTSVTNYAFAGLQTINDIEIHFRGTNPPTFDASTNIQIHSTAKIYVPYSADHSVLAAYKAAPNLSVYADQIYEEEES